MISILKKEINSFFASPIGYLVIGFFLLINGLFLWIFDDDFNILNAGFADLNSFFYLAPWVLLFLIPVLTMKMFADEFQTGTIEILKTTPLSNWEIVLGKFWASLLLILIAIAPTFIYVYTAFQLGSPSGNIDLGSTIGSYLGLFLLAGSYAAIGLFASTFSKNQIVSFLVGVFITFLLFYGFDASASIFKGSEYTVKLFGINEHFKSISRGVIDTRDVTYFLSLIFFFLFITQQKISINKKIKHIVLLIAGLLLINFLNQGFYQRYDITKDGRYTLSSVTTDILENTTDRLNIRVYLEGDFPAEFQRLQVETRQFLEELRAENPNIRIQFVNPDEQQERLVKSGMYPSQLTVEENGKQSNLVIFPWAEIDYKNRKAIVSLLPDGIVQSQEEQFEAAIESLEYSFSSAIQKLVVRSIKKIAILKGNGELEDIRLYSFLSKVREKYPLVAFTLDSVSNNPERASKDIQNFDLAVIAKPSEAFSEKEKMVLDQFIMNGGKTLWMLENVQADTDSLYNSGSMLAYPRDLNLTDLFFSYGIRINNQLVQDLYASKITLVSGNVGNQPQYEQFTWFYDPLVNGNPNHPITKNVAPVRLQFANQIDTLQNDIQKTPLLVSSLLTKKVGTPSLIDLQSISEEPKQEDYQSGYQLLGVLLEGQFTSMYANRIKPFDLPSYQSKSTKNKMIVIADGDVGKNQILKGQPYDLSIDKWTGEQFGNKDFLLNAVDYLLDDTGLIDLRNKSLQINTLDKQKAYQERGFWQFLNVVLPIVLLIAFGFGFNYLRKRRYSS